MLSTAIDDNVKNSDSGFVCFIRKFSSPK